tara:strand:- start:319 stop:762 length:444 start_codon:yes stop_codon:yes gene_type:complete
MAKIKSVLLEAIPETIIVGDDVTDIVVHTTIEFHAIDISLQMEYHLFLLVYDINGKMDIPVIISNWDEFHIYGVSEDRKDRLLGEVVIPITCGKELEEITTPIALKLGKLTKGDSYFSRKLEVFATLIPAIGSASKWSDPFEANLVF